ncbi:unannotated protein [freshwater metagenome]|uniref:Unannotated protein n=1 Tax=freshwater metagenome TaxID=449393 RepID=A0A6J6ETB7_9ZZZZ
MHAAAAHPQGGGAGLGHGHDGLGTQMAGGEQSAHGNRLVDAAESLAFEVGIDFHVFSALSGQTNLGHLFDRLQRVLACRRLRAEHDRIGAVQHGVGHVRHLGTGGHRVGDHAFHHLGGGDDDLVVHFGQFDHAFLQGGHGGVADFDGQIAPGHHDAVTGEQDALEVRNGFCAFDLRNQARLVAELSARHIAQLARHFHVGGVFGEAHRHIVGAQAHGGLDVIHVLGGQRRGCEAAALFVDALVVGQLATQLDGGVHLLTFDGDHIEHDQTVVEQQHVTRFHVAGQFLVIETHTMQVTGFGA